MNVSAAASGFINPSYTWNVESPSSCPGFVSNSSPSFTYSPTNSTASCIFDVAVNEQASVSVTGTSSLYSGQNITLNATVSGAGDTGLRYQWYNNSISGLMSGQTFPTLELTAGEPGVYTYFVIATTVNGTAGVMSNSFTVTVRSVNEPAINGSVSVVDLPTNTVVDDLYGFAHPQGIAFSPNGNTIYVANYRGSSVSIVNTSTGSIIGKISGLGCYREGIEDIALSPDGNTMYVVNNECSQIQVVNVTARSLLHNIPTSSYDPYGIAVSPNGTTMYVSFGDYYTQYNILAFNTSSGEPMYWLGEGEYTYPQGLALSPNGTILYAADNDHSDVEVINASSGGVITLIHGFDDPQSVGLSPDGKTLYVSNEDNNTVSVVDTASGEIVGTIAYAGFDEPKGIAVSSDGNTLYVVNHENEYLYQNNTYPYGPSIDLGQSIALNASWFGGTAPYTIRWYSSTGSCSTTGTPIATYTGYSVFNTVDVSPAEQTNYCYTVRDVANATVGGNDTVYVNPTFTGTLEVTSVLTPLDAGQNETVTASASDLTGGTGSYNYSLLASTDGVHYLPTGATCDLSDYPALTCSYVPSVDGNYYYELTVTDQAYSPVALSSPASGEVTVNSQPSVNLTIRNPVIGPGGTATLFANLTGGTGPFDVSFVFANNSTVAYAVNGVGVGGSASYAFTAQSVGNYLFNIKVTDAGTEIPYVFSIASRGLPATNGSSAEDYGLSVSLPRDYSYYLCDGGSGNGAISYSWNSNATASWNGYSPDSSVGIQSGNVCGIDTGGPALAEAIMGINDSTPTDVYTSAANEAGSDTLDYQVSTSGSSVAIGVSCGWIECSEIDVPAGCTVQQYVNGPDDDETAFFATCTDQKAGNYSVSAYSGSAGIAMAAYVLTPAVEVTVAKGETNTSVSCTPAQVGYTSTCTATVSNSIGDTDGEQINFSITSGDGTFVSGDTCALSSGSCSVGVIPYDSNNRPAVNASYSGDADNLGSSGSANVSIINYVPENVGNGTVSVIGAANGTLLNTVFGFDRPQGIAIADSDGGWLFVANYRGSSVAQVEVSTWDIINFTGFGCYGEGAESLAFSNGMMYVVDNECSRVQVYEGEGGFQANFSTDARPYGIAISPDGSTLYVSLTNGGREVIELLNSTTGSKVGEVDSNVTNQHPQGVALSPDGSTLYVANSDNGTVSVINVSAERINSTLLGFDQPSGLALSPDGSTLYVTNDGNDTVSVVSTASGDVVGTIGNVGLSDPKGVVVSPDGGTIYVANHYTVFYLNQTPRRSFTIDQGQSVTLNASWVGGDEPYTVDWYSSAGLCNASGTLIATYSGYNTSNAISVSPSGTTNYCYSVTDNYLSSINSDQYPVAVDPALGAPTMTSVVSSLDAGQNENVTADVSNVTGTGTGEITYSLLYSTNGTIYSPTGAFCDTDFLPTLTCSYVPSVGNYTYEIAATDEAYVPVTTATAASNNVEVSTQPSVNLGVQNSTIGLGETGEVYANLTGGTGPFNVSFIFANNGTVANTVVGVPVGSNVTYAFNGTVAGNYLFNVSVTDAGTSVPYVFSFPGAFFSTSAAAPGAASLDVPLPSGYTSYVCEGGSAYSEMTQSWTPDVTAPWPYSSVGRQSGNSCNVSGSGLAEAGLGIDGPSPSGVYTRSILSGGSTLNYEVNVSGSSVVIGIACGHVGCDGISVPSGCTELAGLYGSNDYSSVYLATCSGQAAGWYQAQFSGVSPYLPADMAAAAYVFTDAAEIRVVRSSTLTSVSCTPAEVGDESTCTATVSNSIGDTDNESVSFSIASGSGIFFSTDTCALSGGSCSVGIVPYDSKSAPEVNASYSGDSTNLASWGLGSAGVINYVPESTGNGTVSVIDAYNGTLLRIIPSGFDHPQGAVLSSNGSTLYVANYRGSSISIINTSTGNITRTIPGLGHYYNEGIESIALSPDGRTLYAIDNEGYMIEVINLTTGSIANTFNTLPEYAPYGIAVSPDGSTLYVSFTHSNGYVSAINATTGAPIWNINVSDNEHPQGMALSPLGTILYVANSGNDTVSSIFAPGAEITGTFFGFDDPSGIAFAPHAPYIYVTNDGNDTVSVVDEANGSIVGTFSNAGLSDPKGVAVSPDGSTIYVANHYSDFSLNQNSMENYTIDSGQTLQLNASWSGGTEPYTIYWYSSTGLCNSTGTPVSSYAVYALNSSVNVSPTEATNYCYSITDNHLTSINSNQYRVSVNPALGAPTIDSVTTPIDSGQGEAVIGDVSNVTGTGTGEISYSLLYSTNGTTYAPTRASCSVDAPSINCSYEPSAGNYTYEIAATDEAYVPATATSAASNAVTVNTQPNATLSVQDTTIDLGNSVNLYANLTGGTGPFNVSFVFLDNGTVANVVTGVPIGGNVVYNFIPSGAGEYNFSVNVTDTGTAVPYNFNVVPAITEAAASSSNSSLDVTLPPTSLVYLCGGGASGDVLNYVDNYGLFGTSDFIPLSSQIIQFGSVCGYDTPGPGISVSEAGMSPFLFLDGYYDGGNDSASHYFTQYQNLTYNVPDPDSSVVLSVSCGNRECKSVSTPAGCTVLQWVNSSDSNSTAYLATCAHQAAGNYTVNTTLSGIGVASMIAFVFNTPVLNGPTSVRVNPAISISNVSMPSAVDLGQTISLSANAMGGNGHYTTEQWYLSSDDNNDSLGIPVGGGPGLVSNDVPSVSGTPEYYLTVSDGNATSAATTPLYIVDVNSALGSPTLDSVSATSIDAGQNVTVAGDVSNVTGTGTGNVTYSLLASTDGANYTSTGANCTLSTPALSCTYMPPVGGNYTFELAATDSASVPVTAVSGASPILTVNVFTGQSVSVSPNAYNIDLGHTMQLSANASGLYFVGAPTYSWGTYGGGSCPGFSDPGNVSSFYYTPASATDNCAFVVYATDSFGDEGMGITYPQIVVNPALGVNISVTSTADVGQNITLNASSIFGGTGSYRFVQWYSDGTTDDNYSNPVPFSSGMVVNDTQSVPGTYYYDFVVYDGDAELRTPAYAVAVSPALGTPSAPSSVTTPIDVGQNVTVKASVNTVVGTGTGSITYGLLESLDGGAYVPATGAICTESSYEEWANAKCTYAPSAAGNYTYEVTATDQASVPVTTASGPSSQATVYNALSISVQPTPSREMDVGQTVTLSATVTGGSGSYSWAWFDGYGYISGAYGSGPTATYTAQNQNNDYYVVFKDKGVDSSARPKASIGSNASSLTLSSPLGGTPTITPANATIDNGQYLMLTANVSGVSDGVAPYTYQWSTSDNADCSGTLTPIAGANSTTYYVVGSSSTYYCVTVSDSSNADQGPESVTSSAASSITVDPALGMPFIKSVSTPIDQGQNATIVATPVNGTGSGGTITYTLLNSTDDTDFMVAPTQDCAYSDGNVICTDTPAVGTYYAVQANDEGTTQVNEVVSPASREVVVNPAPTIAITPSTDEIDAGQNVTFTNVTAGTPPFAFSYLTNASDAVVTGNEIEFPSAGTYNVVEYSQDATGANVVSNEETVTVDSASGSFSSVAQGPIGTEVTFTVGGLKPDGDYDLYFSDAGQATYATVSTFTTDGSGLYTGSFELPQDLATCTPGVCYPGAFQAEIRPEQYSNYIEDIGTYSTTVERINLSASSGGVSDVVSLTATGLSPGVEYDVYLDSSPGTKSNFINSCTADSDGDITGTGRDTHCPLGVPSVGAGTYYVDLFENASSNYVFNIAPQTFNVTN
jgi:YVTN family beta-propeller protein